MSGERLGAMGRLWVPEKRLLQFGGRFAAAYVDQVSDCQSQSRNEIGELRARQITDLGISGLRMAR